MSFLCYMSGPRFTVIHCVLLSAVANKRYPVLWHLFGAVLKRSTRADCKSVAFGLRRFKSFPRHHLHLSRHLAA